MEGLGRRQDRPSVQNPHQVSGVGMTTTIMCRNIGYESESDPKHKYE